MFSFDELKAIAAALVVQEKSVLRLAAKDGQPDTVAAEYRKVAAQIQVVMRKVVAALDDMQTKQAKK